MYFATKVVTYPVFASLVVLLLLACGPAEEATPAEEPGPTLSDFAGTWQLTITVPGVEDPIPATITGDATADGWTMDLEDRSGIRLQASVVGDSLITRSAEYESILRPGVMVTVRTASVEQDGMLTGNMVANYQTADGEESVTGTIHGTRVR